MNNLIKIASWILLMLFIASCNMGSDNNVNDIETKTEVEVPTSSSIWGGGDPSITTWEIVF